MPLNFTTTREAASLHGVKICVHGRAGVGKTTLVKTLPKPLLLSAESGILSLRNEDIPTIVIKTFQDFRDAYAFVSTSEHAAEFESVALDSISEIAEVCLANEMAMTKDGRKAYGELNTKMSEMIRKFRDLSGKHVYFSAKMGQFTDEVTSVTRYGPHMPGRSLTQSIPYFFDELFCLDIGKVPDTGQEYRFLRTKTDLQFEAKDRSGALDPMEEPHLGKVINKILAAVEESN